MIKKHKKGVCRSLCITWRIRRSRCWNRWWFCSSKPWKNVSQKELQEFVEKETRKLRDNLDEMIDDYENSKAATQIAEADKVKIKEKITGR